MDIKQAVNLLKQAVDISLASGAFKKTEDVVVIHEALSTVQTFVLQTEASKEPAKELVEKVKKVK